MSRGVARGVAVAALIVVAVIQVLHRLDGFPDGFLSQYDRAMRVPRLALEATTLAFALWLLVAGMRHSANTRRLVIATLVAALLLAGFEVLSQTESLRHASGLEYGQGG